jgi:hypothetical protein
MSQGDAGLPLARVRRVMKSEDSIRAVTVEAGVLVAKATELFLGALAQRALESGGVGARKKEELTYDAVATVVRNTTSLDFLRDIVPLKVQASSVLGAPKSAGELR